MKHHLGMNAQSSRLVCVRCKEKVTVFAMGNAGAGRTAVARACVKCRRLVKTTLLPPAHPPFPRSCLEEHPHRCEGPDYTLLKGTIGWSELHEVLRTITPIKPPGLDEVTSELLKAAPPRGQSNSFSRRSTMR